MSLVRATENGVPVRKKVAPETCQRLAQRLGFDLPLPSETERIFAEQERAQLDLL